MTKQQLLDFVRENNVKVEEVHKGGIGPDYAQYLSNEVEARLGAMGLADLTNGNLSEMSRLAREIEEHRLSLSCVSRPAPSTR